jgi:argininosuccinate lyase
LDLAGFRRFSAKFDQGVYGITAASAVAARDVLGGTAPRRVEAALAEARKLLEAAPDGF